MQVQSVFCLFLFLPTTSLPVEKMVALTRSLGKSDHRAIGSDFECSTRCAAPIRAASRTVPSSPCFESLLHDLRPFLDQALHACAFLVFWTLMGRLEYLFDSRNVYFGLFQVLLEALTQFVRGGSLGQVGINFFGDVLRGALEAIFIARDCARQLCSCGLRSAYASQPRPSAGTRFSGRSRFSRGARVSSGQEGRGARAESGTAVPQSSRRQPSRRRTGAHLGTDLCCSWGKPSCKEHSLATKKKVEILDTTIAAANDGAQIRSRRTKTNFYLTS